MLAYEISSPVSHSIYHADCFDLLPTIDIAEGGFDLCFADPPYYLSRLNGTTCKAGKRANVSKGEWDAPLETGALHEFNLKWLVQVNRVLNENGTIFVSGTFHNIHSIGLALQQLGFRILNNIAWNKVNPPPNLGCRCFTHSTETIIWAAKGKGWFFDYATMKAMNDGKQMTDTWYIPSPRGLEVVDGKHPTQKPLELLRRCLMAACPSGGWVLDPFCGSATTGIAALGLGMNFVGVEKEPEYVELAKRRYAHAAKAG